MASIGVLFSWKMCMNIMVILLLTLSHIQQICRRRLWKHLNNNIELSPKWRHTWVENIVTIEVIAHYERFILLPQCFQNSSAAEVSEKIYMREGVNYPNQLYKVWFSNSTAQLLFTINCFNSFQHTTIL